MAGETRAQGNWAEKTVPKQSMNFQARLTVVFVAFMAAFFYINLSSHPAKKNEQPKIYSATTNEVVAMLGQPLRIVDSTNFIEGADEMAEEGSPVSTADMRAKGMVWLYPEGGMSGGARLYRTIFFDANNRVYAVYRTYWMKDWWGDDQEVRR